MLLIWYFAKYCHFEGFKSIVLQQRDDLCAKHNKYSVGHQMSFDNNMGDSTEDLNKPLSVSQIFL